MTAPAGPRAVAHMYLDRGFSPIPWFIGQDGRKCVAIKGFSYRDYTVSHADIDRWPKAQVGLVMSQRSGYWCLDFDCTQARIDEFCSQFVVPETACQQTGRGMHLAYRGTGGCEWPRDGIWSADWPDVQVRSNGFIAAAPSWHPNGRQYRWLDDRMPAVPGTLLLALRPPRQARPKLAGLGGKRDDGLDGDLVYYAQHGIPMGWQDTEIWRLACKHVRAMDREELTGWLWAAACHSAQNRANPWRIEDIRSKVAKAAGFIAAEDAAAMRSYREMEAAGYGR